MTKLVRKYHKVFGAAATESKIGQFGSANLNEKIETKDIDEIQALEAWDKGWEAGTIGENRYPSLQERNGVDYEHSYQTGYILQEGIPEWDEQTEYHKGSVVKVLVGDNIMLYSSTVDSNLGHTLNESDYWREISFGGGSGLEIADIGIASLGIDETQNKRRYLNGQLLIQEQFVSFTNKVKNAVELYPSLACTEEEWQATVTMSTFGQCGKFVIDDEAGTIRLPKITGFIQGLTDLASLGELVEAGLSTLTTDTVQLEAIRYPYFIQVATGAEETVDVTREIELNNPFFFGYYQYFEIAPNNISWLKSRGQWNSKAIYTDYYDWILTNANNGVENFKLSTDTYDDYAWVVNTAEETFRLPVKVKQKFYTLPSNVPIEFAGGTFGRSGFNLYKVGLFDGDGTQDWTDGYARGLVATGTAHLGSNNKTTDGTISTIYVGARANLSDITSPSLYLYFYVGETVQNANLVNVGRIEEKLVDKVDKSGDTMTGALSVPTPAYSDNSTKVATTAFVKSVLSSSGNGLATFQKSANGYIKFSNGVIVQWGRHSFDGATYDKTGTITLPTSFTSGTTYSVAGTGMKGAELTNLGTTISVANMTATSFYFRILYTVSNKNGASWMTWIAIGY